MAKTLHKPAVSPMISDSLLLEREEVQIMKFDDIAELKKQGFVGFETVAQLRASGCAEVSDKAGVYLVLRPDTEAPEFLAISTGGHFKGKNPTQEIQHLIDRWVPESRLVYIGKAGDSMGKRTLRKRLREFVRFGAGENVAHWGGRFTWQLKDSENLIICWKPISEGNPRDIEKDLIESFRVQYLKRPFANINA